jgi:hypothetical protein
MGDDERSEKLTFKEARSTSRELGPIPRFKFRMLLVQRLEKFECDDPKDIADLVTILSRFLFIAALVHVNPKLICKYLPTPKEQILFLLILSGLGQLHASRDKLRLRKLYAYNMFLQGQSPGVLISVKVSSLLLPFFI